uniref:Uncharacterized protein n=1 Tax=Arundo donax TaxID=35708 RepID=A0A0A8ZMM2_ARUDO
MDSSRGPASIFTQANALLRKNLCVQKQNLKTNIGITFFPILICMLLVVLQNIINSELDKPKYECCCACVQINVDGSCAKKECGIQYSTLEQIGGLLNSQPATVAGPDSGPPCRFPGCQDILPAFQ